MPAVMLVAGVADMVHRLQVCVGIFDIILHALQSFKVFVILRDFEKVRGKLESVMTMCTRKCRHYCAPRIPLYG